MILSIIGLTYHVTSVRFLLTKISTKNPDGNFQKICHKIRKKFIYLFDYYAVLCIGAAKQIENI